MTGPPGGAGPDPRWPASAGAAAQVFVADLAAPDLSPADAHHLARVLRLGDGAAVVAADGQGGWRLCRLAMPGPGLVVDGPVVRCPAPTPLLTVAFVPVKGDRPEWVVQKLTELGVDRIVVLRAERSVVRWDREPGQQDRAVERLRRVAEAAAAQSRRARLPVVDGVSDLASLAAEVAPVPLGLAEPGGPPPRLEVPVVAVGPEGGWSPTELATAGGVRVGLGDSVLRAETAALAAGALLCALRGGMVAPGSEYGAAPDPSPTRS